MKMELRKISPISCWCTVSSLSARKVLALKRASDAGVGDENPAVKVSRSGSHSANDQPLSTVVNLLKVGSFTPLTHSTMQLVDCLNPTKDNLEVKTTSHPSKLVTPSLQSLFPPQSPVAS